MARGMAILATAAVLGLSMAGTAAAAKPKVAKRTIGGAGISVPRSFAGLSIEYTSALDYFGVPGKPNGAFLQLLRTLGAGGTGTPTIRLGGNSGDASWWNPDGAARPAGVDTDLTPEWLSALRPVNEQAGARFVLGGNFAIADPARAVAFVNAAVGTLPAGAVSEFELGNEADIYDRAATFHVGNLTFNRPQRRATGYALPQYLAELDAYLGALNAARTPDWPAIAVGGFATNAWAVKAPAVLDHVGKAASFFQAHGYPLNRCRARHVPGKRWRAALLDSAGRLPVSRARRLVRVARPRGVSVRVAEINSATCGGAHGVSDTFASALWAADVLFGFAEDGVAGVNLHTWTGAWYAPVSFAPGPSGAVATVRPLLYGMLFFDRAVANRARLLHVRGPHDDAVKVWATRDAGKTVRVAVINPDPDHRRRVQLRLPRGLGSGTLERLRAHTLASRSGATFAGQSFERGAFDGRLHGTTRRTRVPRRGRIYRFQIPAASAALLTARRR
jgi:hypothetical protein